ncbi:MAG: polyprenyl synthetase family protein [Calditrichota bacterium]
MTISDHMTLSTFQAPIKEDLERFRRSYRNALESGLFLIDRVVAYLTRSHGKGLRPTLTLLSARLGSDRISEDAIRAAVIMELLHEATLVHDDVVDEAPERRGLPSLAARFKNKVSVLFGDYMLAKVLTETLGARNLIWLDILADTARRMARGELIQAARSKRLDLTEEDYLDMIGDKTAALFSACCRMGGLCGGLAENCIQALGKYGEAFGIAFQIRDDMLDLFGDDRLIGKPVGGDLKERKLTLPILRALKQVSPREARRIRARIRRGIKFREINYIRDFVRDQGGDIYAEQVMREQSEIALRVLQAAPSSPIRELMEKLVEFAIQRRR